MAYRKPSKVLSPSQSQQKNLTSSAGSLTYAGRRSVAWRGDKFGFKVPKYQNSYRLEPHLAFRSDVSDKILIDAMTKIFADAKYVDQDRSTSCREAAAAVLDRLYKTDYDRVKYVVTVSVVERADQGICVGSGRLWDPTRDAYSVFVYEAPTFYATGLVHVLYYE